MSDLKIQITGSLDTKSTATEINRQLSSLENDIDKVKLSNVSFDFSELTKSINELKKSIKEFSVLMTKHSNITKDYNKVIKENKTVIKDLDGTVREVTQKHLKSGEIIVKETERINKQTQSLKKQENAIDGVVAKLDKLSNVQKKVTKLDSAGNFDGGSVKVGDGTKDKTINYNKDLIITKQSITDNYDKQEKSMESLRQSLLKLYNQGKVTKEEFKRFNNSVDASKNIKEIEKLKKELDGVVTTNTNKTTQQKLLTDAETLKRTHKNTVDISGVDKTVENLKKINPAALGASNSLRKVQSELVKYSTEAKEAARSSMTFTEMLTTGIKKMTVWGMSAQFIYQPLRAIQDMTTRLFEIDKLMTDIGRVTNMPDFKLTELLGEAVQVSDELSTKLTNVLSTIGDFSRMGFSDDQLIDITKTSQVLQNISDLNATEAVD